MTIRTPRRVVGLILAAILALPLLVTPTAPAHAATVGTIFGTTWLNLRAGTSSSTAALASIPASQKLTLVCQSKGQLVHGPRSTEWWAKTTYQGKTGYVSRAYVKSSGSLPTCSSTPPSATATGTVVGASTLTVRRGEHSGYAKLTTAPRGAKLTLQCKVTGKYVSGHYNSSTWLKTRYNGKTGYVSKAYVSANISSLPTCARSSVDGTISRSEIIHRARFWVDRAVPYSQSRYTYDVRGKNYRTDCSGLASMALHKSSSLSTLSSPSAWGVYRISKDSLQPGDLVGNLGRCSSCSGHVVVFLKWANSAKTQFYTLEETPGRAVQKLRNWGDSYWNKQAWRYKKLG